MHGSGSGRREGVKALSVSKVTCCNIIVYDFSSSGRRAVLHPWGGCTSVRGGTDGVATSGNDCIDGNQSTTTNYHTFEYCAPINAVVCCGSCFCLSTDETKMQI